MDLGHTARHICFNEMQRAPSRGLRFAPCVLSMALITCWRNLREINKELSPPVADTGAITWVAQTQEGLNGRTVLHAQGQTPAQDDDDSFVSYSVLQ